MSLLLIRRAKSVIRYGKDYGIHAMLRLVWRRLRDTQAWRALRKTDPLTLYNFVQLPPVMPVLNSGDAPKNTINWVIPPFGKGSGGHLNIFRFIANLERLGYECRIIIVGHPQPVSSEQASKEINQWFFPLVAQVYIGIENAPAGNYTIATEWRTAYWVRNFATTAHRCYFVQDFEPWFFPMGADYVFAEETYRFGFTGITAGGWLKEKLASEYGMKTYSVGFSYDRELYEHMPSRKDTVRRVFFYSRPVTPRRAFELGLLVLNEVVSRVPNVEVVLAGWDVSDYAIPFKHRSVGLLSLDKLPGLYNQCDVALVLSMSNLSLLPLELMACGVPIVSNKAPWTEWLLNADNARLASPNTHDLADALCSVLNDSAEAQRLRNGGLKTAKNTDWKVEASNMADILDSLDRHVGDLHRAEAI